MKHEDIPGLMPAMTMSLGVRPASLLEGLAPGDLIEGTLSVSDTDAWLSALRKVGSAPLPSADEEAAVAPAAPPMDVLEVGEAVPDVALVDQTGRRFRFSEYRGTPVALTFIYTRCPLPTFCPLMDQRFAAVQARLRDADSSGSPVRLLSVSFDPDHDTPKVLAAHATSVGADPAIWRFATGERDAIDGFASRFGVSVMREGTGAGDITHNLATAVVGPDGRLTALFLGRDWTPDALLEALGKAAGSGTR